MLKHLNQYTGTYKGLDVLSYGIWYDVLLIKATKILLRKPENREGITFVPPLLFRQLYLILSMLVHKDEGVKLEADTEKEEEKEKNNDKETNSLIVSIFQIIKCSEDVVDREKSKVGKMPEFVCCAYFMHNRVA